MPVVEGLMIRGFVFVAVLAEYVWMPYFGDK